MKSLLFPIVPRSIAVADQAPAAAAQFGGMALLAQFGRISAVTAKHRVEFAMNGSKVTRHNRVDAPPPKIMNHPFKVHRWRVIDLHTPMPTDCFPARFVARNCCGSSISNRP